jgi:hypothetical protein
MTKFERYQKITLVVNKINYYKSFLKALQNKQLKVAAIDLRFSGIKNNMWDELTHDEVSILIKRRIREQRKILKSI